MSNCSRLFREFNQTIKLTSERRNSLIARRTDLRNRIITGYDIVRTSNNLDYDLVFHSQGSFVMDTIINPHRKEDRYDLDDGVYFHGHMQREERPEPGTFHNWVMNSIETGKSANEVEKIVDKNTCVRVIYRGTNDDFNYHIDIPIYYVRDADEPDLANKKVWWQESNPINLILWFESLTDSGFRKEFILEQRDYIVDYRNWFDDVVKNDHQLRRIVRYLKAWGDYCKEDMPPGIIMTILAGYNYVPDTRDDLSMKYTLENIRNYLNDNGFKCPRPTTPKGEDLFSKYSHEKKKYFWSILNDIIEIAIKAIQNPNQKESCLEWKKHFGGRFPCSQAKNEKDYSSLAAASSKSNMWSNFY